MHVQIKTEDLIIDAELYDTLTGKAIGEALPIEGRVNRWGGEIYFTIGVNAPLEPDAREVLKPSELAFWPPGNAFCIFFGATPASQNEECRAASDVNVFGKVTDDLSELWNVKSGTTIIIEKT